MRIRKVANITAYLPNEAPTAEQVILSIFKVSEEEFAAKLARGEYDFLKGGNEDELSGRHKQQHDRGNVEPA